MSEYSYDDRPRHRHRPTREREPEYVQETTYIERGGRGAPPRDLVYRPAREDSIEDIPRDFPPPGGAEYRQTKYRETYEPRRGHRDAYDDYDRRDDRRSRHSRDTDYYSDDYERRPKPQRRKSVVDNLKEIGEAAGLGGVIGAVTGNRSRSRSRPRKERHDRGYDSEYDDRYGRDDRRSRRYSSSERSRSRSRGGGARNKNAKWEQAAKAAIVAGAVEAFRSRKTPGPWTGAKGQRIATAALGAAGIDSLVTSDKKPDEHSKRHVAESAIGGLLANRLANGSRSRSRPRGRDGSRSPSRSRSRSRSIFGRSRSRGRSASRGREDGEGGGANTLKNVAGAGAVLAAGKALYDRVRSKSRSRRDRSRSVSSEDSYVPSRSRRNRAYSDHGRSMDGYSDAPPRANSDRRLAAAGAAGAGAGAGASSVSRSKGRLDSSDSESTTDMEQKRKKLRAANPYPPTSYADANPYGAVPPPPIGAPPPARY